MSLWSTTSDFLKDVWAPGLSRQLENGKGTLYGMIDKSGDSDVRFEGRRVYKKLSIGESRGQSMMTQGGDFPTPRDPVYDEAQLDMGHFGHAISWDSDELAKADSDKAAAAPIIQEKMERAKDTMYRELCRQTWSGQKPLANVSSASGTMLVLDETTTAQVDRDRYIWLDDGYRLRYTTATSSFTEGTTDFDITLIEEDNGTVHCGTTMTASDASDQIWVVNSYSGTVSLEFQGIQDAVADTGTYLGLSRTSFGWWKSPTLDNSTTLRPLSENLVHQLVNRVQRRSTMSEAPGEGTGHRAFANFGPWTAYHNLIAPGLRYTLESKPDIGWNKPLNMLGIPLYKDPQCPQNRIYLLHIPSFRMVKPAHNGYDQLMKFKELGGSIFFQGNASSGQGHSANVYSYLEGFCGLMTDRPRNHGLLDDITGVAEAY